MIRHQPGASLNFTLAVLSTMAIGAGLVLGNLLASGEARKAADKIRVRSVSLNTVPRIVTDQTAITSELPAIRDEILY